MIYITDKYFLARETGLDAEEAEKVIEYFEGNCNNVNLADIKYCAVSWQFWELRDDYNIPITVEDKDLARWMSENIGYSIYIQCADSVVSIE